MTDRFDRYTGWGETPSTPAFTRSMAATQDAVEARPSFIEISFIVGFIASIGVALLVGVSIGFGSGVAICHWHEVEPIPPSLLGKGTL